MVPVTLVVPAATAAPEAPEGAPAPVTAVDCAVEVAHAAPVLPPRAVSVVVAAPVVPDVVSPSSRAVAAPEVPPPAVSETAAGIARRQVHRDAAGAAAVERRAGAPGRAVDRAAVTGGTGRQAAERRTAPAGTVGVEVAAPLSPEEAMPLARVFESPETARASEPPRENASPESPPSPVSPEAASPVAVPPAPVPPPPALVLPEEVSVASVAAPEAPDAPPLPLVAVDRTEEHAHAEPVLPPIAVSVVVAAPVPPEVVFPRSRPRPRPRCRRPRRP